MGSFLLFVHQEQTDQLVSDRLYSCQGWEVLERDIGFGSQPGAGGCGHRGEERRRLVYYLRALCALLSSVCVKHFSLCVQVS